MIKILLVDDDNLRTRMISSCIDNYDVEVELATTKQRALELMSEVRFDLVIIDIMLPENISAINPSKYAGTELIDDIMSLNRIKMPQNIIGVTSEEEVFKSVKPQFDSKMIPIIYWNQSDEKWKEALEYKVKYIVRNNCQQNLQTINSVIITAVEDEYNAVKNSMDNWQNFCFEDDPCIYLLNKYTVNGKEKTLLLVKLQEMGMTAASNVCTKVVLRFSPEKILMVGICGGVKGKVDLGDLIVASTSWDYGNGKIKPRESADDGEYYEFEAAPNQIPSSYTGLDKFRESSLHIFNEIIEKWNNSHQGSEVNPKLHIGPMPSGASVICDSSLYEQIIRPQHRKCLGLDMETYAIYYASKNTVEHGISFLSIKGVSDFADVEKDDSYHNLCCFLVANFTIECLKNGLL